MKNSRVWSHFNMVNENKSQCIHCKKIISKNGGTSNLKKHLTRKHPEFCTDLDLKITKKSYDNNESLQDLVLDLNFNNEKIKNFISVVQMNSILYSKMNERNLTYYERQSCNTIWEEIAQEFEINENDCRRLWFALRKQYSTYIKTKDPEKCKYIDELAFLDEYLQNRIEKISMKDEDTSTNNYDLIDETKKVLISVPEISGSPIHEISVNKTELGDDENENYEVLYEEYDPILVKNQSLDDPKETCGDETIFSERNELRNQSRKTILERSKQQQKNSNRYEYRTEIHKNNKSLSEDQYNSNIRIETQRVERPKIDRSYSSPKRIKKSTDGMDEIDFFFEFLQRKLRKMSPSICRQLQMKFMETIQEAEQRSRKYVDRSVETSDSFE